MTLSEESTAKLKHAAVYAMGFPGVLGGVGLFTMVGGVVLLIVSWPSPTQWDPPIWMGLLAFAIGVLLAAIGGELHHRRYMALAKAAGLSDAQAEALSDQADEEQDD